MWHILRFVNTFVSDELADASETLGPAVPLEPTEYLRGGDNSAPAYIAVAHMVHCLCEMFLVRFRPGGAAADAVACNTVVIRVRHTAGCS